MQLGHWSFYVCVCSISSHRHTHDTSENNAEEKLKNVQISSLNVWVSTTKHSARSSVSSRTVQILTSTSSPSWNWVEAEAEDELGGSRTSVAATVLHRWQLQSQHQFQVTATLKTSATGHQLPTKYTVTQKSHSQFFNIHTDHLQTLAKTTETNKTRQCRQRPVTCYQKWP